MSIKAVRGQANDGLSSALLVVFLDSARNLPVSQSAPNVRELTASSYSQILLRRQHDENEHLSNSAIYSLDASLRKAVCH